MPKRSLSLCALLALAGCATETIPPLDHTHPASPSAAESPVAPLARLLGPDPLTRRTRTLIAERKAAVERPANDPSHGELPPAPSSAPGAASPNTKKPTGHEHH